MRDGMEARLWAEHGRRYSADMHKLLKSIMIAFRRLAAINYSAPWRARSTRSC